MRFKNLLFALLLLLSIGIITAQEPPEGYQTTIQERALVYAGPGDTFPIVAELGAEFAVTVVERTPIGNWLRVIRPVAEGDDIDGWVMTGFINIEETVRFSEDIPVNMTVENADVSGFIDEDIIRLYETPLIPGIGETVREIYENGQALGNHADVVSKIGDSNSVAAGYLPSSDEAEYDLGPYDFLQDTVEHFGPSFQTGSIAARIGLNAFSVFDPFWSNNELCEPDEIPLACEYRVSQPTVALILFGPNDLRALNTDQFREQISLIVETTIEAGVIPVLYTFSSKPELDNWFQAIRFNLILLDVAEEYDVPLINLWAAARILPNRGIGSDDVHMTVSGANVRLLGQESRFGINLQNLLALHTLDAIYHTLELAD